jgi:hypothetical protein
MGTRRLSAVAPPRTARHHHPHAGAGAMSRVAGARWCSPVRGGVDGAAESAAWPNGTGRRPGGRMAPRAAGGLPGFWLFRLFRTRGGVQSTYLYADLPMQQCMMQGWWVVDSGSLDFPCVSVKNMEIWRALT